jgi:hypothetical protein
MACRRSMLGCWELVRNRHAAGLAQEDTFRWHQADLRQRREQGHRSPANMAAAIGVGRIVVHAYSLHGLTARRRLRENTDATVRRGSPGTSRAARRGASSVRPRWRRWLCARHGQPAKFRESPLRRSYRDLPDPDLNPSLLRADVVLGLPEAGESNAIRRHSSTAELKR